MFQYDAIALCILASRVAKLPLAQHKRPSRQHVTTSRRRKSNNGQPNFPNWNDRCVARGMASETLQTLRALIRAPFLDEHRLGKSAQLDGLEAQLTDVGARAWSCPDVVCSEDTAQARLESQRALYELNRLRVYWGDEPEAYLNEHSPILLGLQRVLEKPWRSWLDAHTPELPFELEAIGERLQSAFLQDRIPSDNEADRWFSLEMNLSGYRRLLEIGSVNALVEASQLSRALGGAPTAVQATLTRIFLEEYGAGRLAKKHSTYFAQMLMEQGLRVEPEAYLDTAPWEVLVSINHAFFLAEGKRHYLRFCGAFTYTEVSTPASYDGFAKAARRLGLSDGHGDYWALHVREDERHGAWMVEQVALPLMQQFPHRKREVLMGYEQQRFVERLAGASVLNACREAAIRGEA